MTEKRFSYSSEKEGYCLDDEYFCEMEDTEEITMLLNAQQETIVELRKELEDWKSNCLSTINENSILWNEIAIMREQGAKPSSAFEEYCNKFKGDVE